MDLFKILFRFVSLCSDWAILFGLGAFVLGVFGVLGVAALIGVADFGLACLFGIAFVSAFMFDFFLFGLFSFSSSLI